MVCTYNIRPQNDDPSFLNFVLIFLVYSSLFLKCFLGLEFLNTNISGEMAQYLMSVQSKYVPQISKGDEKLLQPIFLDGDQLTEERARNVQWVFQDGDNQADRLEGLDLTHADWHAKVNLYEVCKGRCYYLMHGFQIQRQREIMFNK